MITRYNWQLRHLSFNTHPTKASPRPSAKGVLLIGGLTVLFATWLFYRTLAQPGWLALLPPVLEELLELSETAGVFTLLLLWTALGWQWWQRQAAPPPPVKLSIAELYALSPSDFEKYVARLFRRKGYRVKLRGRSGDHGVDLMVTQPGGRRAIVQCKRYQHTISPEIVRELFGTLVHERVAHAFLVTTADISDAARAWARNKPMTLIDGDTLLQIAAALDQQNGE